MKWKVMGVLCFFKNKDIVNTLIMNLINTAYIDFYLPDYHYLTATVKLSPILQDIEV